MSELTAETLPDYLRRRRAVSDGELLIKQLSGGIAGAVFMVMDMGAGEPIGTDMRTEGQKKAGKPDKRMREGRCFVVKQPLEQFNTTAEWRVDRDRIHIERDCMAVLHALLPPLRVPEPLWLDDANFVLAMTAAPAGAAAWKGPLLAGRINQRLADDAGELLASLHNRTNTRDDIRSRFADLKGFIQQRIDPYFNTIAKVHSGEAAVVMRIAAMLEQQRICLVHGDFSPKNMLVWTHQEADDARLMLLDFEVAHWGNPAFDVATLINHLLLKGFYHQAKWRPYMFAADAFWQTYQQQANSDIVKESQTHGGKVLGCLLLARMDGKSPVEYITDAAVKNRIRDCARHLLAMADDSLDAALDETASFME